MKKGSLSEIKTIKYLNLRNPSKKANMSKILDVTNKFITQNLMVFKKRSEEDETIERYHEERNRMMNQKTDDHSIIERQQKLIARKKKNIVKKFQFMKFALNNNMILDEIMRNESTKNHILNSENFNSNKKIIFVTNYNSKNINRHLPLKQKEELSDKNIKYKINNSLTNKINNNKLDKIRCLTSKKNKPHLMSNFYNEDFKRFKSIKRRNLKNLLLLNTNDRSNTNTSISGCSFKLKQKKTNIDDKKMITFRNKSSFKSKNCLYKYNKISLINISKISSNKE